MDSTITEEELLFLLKEAVEDVSITCPKCEAKMEADNPKCQCGWINQLREKGFI